MSESPRRPRFFGTFQQIVLRSFVEQLEGHKKYWDDPYFFRQVVKAADEYCRFGRVGIATKFSVSTQMVCRWEAGTFIPPLERRQFVISTLHEMVSGMLTTGEVISGTFPKIVAKEDPP